MVGKTDSSGVVVSSVARMLRTSPQKLNLLAAMIRGKRVSRAVADLSFSRKRMASSVKKCLESAIDGAENVYGLDPGILFVSEAYVGKAAVMKRIQIRARGRAFRIKKPFSNLTVKVQEMEVD